jgi:hypothetical protein
VATSRRRKRMDPEQAAIKRAEWADMQAHNEYWADYWAKRERRRQQQLERRERERREAEPLRKILSTDTPAEEAAAILNREFGHKPPLAEALAKIGLLFGPGGTHLGDVARAALDAKPGEPPPGPGVYGFAKAVAEDAGDEEAARRYAEQAARLTGEAEERRRRPGNR